jgi:2-iminoacetate synthase ThiH
MVAIFIRFIQCAFQAQRKSERDAKKAEEEAIRAERKRQKDECTHIQVNDGDEQNLVICLYL